MGLLRRSPRPGRWFLALALMLWAGGAARDGFDRFIDATVIPPLAIDRSVEVLDRNGDLLRAYTVADGRWRLAVGLDAVDRGYVDMLVRYEDKRFWTHPGIDLRAIGRAAAQGLRYGRLVSGGSTLTMQVARLIENSGTGSWQGKLRQMRVALALERRLGKEEILTLYLNHAPFGGNLEGVRAASYAWFGKPPRRLTPAEAALLVAIPQSPNTRRPDRDPDTAHAARDRVLERMRGAGLLDPETVAAALTEPSPRVRRDFPILAPHLSDRARITDPLADVHALTLARDMQTRMEDLAAQAVEHRGDKLQIALMVADHRTGEILASVGSSAYTADAREGFVDMTQALRSPGSTLKPLIYGLAFDRGLVHPETLIADRPVDFDGYRPQNFDGLWRGELPVRDALRLSLNVPVVSLTHALGPDHLIAGLRRAGVEPVLPGGRPGLAISLGGMGLRLEDLVALFGSIANGGERIDLRWHPQPSAGFRPERVMGSAPAWQVADILRETPRPPGVADREIAFKTGTSYGHRDTWAIGFDGRHVVGVWMGRADGTPVPGVFGGALAAPVLFSAFERIGEVEPLPPPPPQTLLLGHGGLPQPLRRFAPPGGGGFEAGPEIAFPPDGAVVEGTALTARVQGGVAPFTWLANGAPVATSRTRHTVLDGLGPGFSDLTVIDAEGRSAAVSFRLD
ncbi:penicillin-binding protein 1C [Ponticoccus sp. SC2-23]|nr:penicillin-binding protein 1C [Ponticoccus sp. SC6-9]MBM1224617.1 penicillin-binding protein 1C [Ponticoccus sp. SC6-15]MBM1228130.1 penicillin-binding protein 1C [Ponticoccus sp. SC6-38]MBM1234232.1 penicillin-binding protein 1C [Ponticoccus sp. SC6-45]MBM1238632.1 penicillin-binding protein 1C [Ponticoccus sp. SC6-49]MBM1242413.1 penicillin-binding protein 1C [Ponticoccus sp. SC2-64]MBM1247756.1 penicillin-binding protein 1C [Ponticoccus sp. SC6-42]MBM1251585.1 penicillin-binding protei